MNCANNPCYSRNSKRIIILHKKKAKLSETKEDLLRKQTELEREVISLREQVMNLQQKPSDFRYHYLPYLL